MAMIIRQYNLMVTQFFEAQNGAEAVQIAKQEQMDIVFMDIKMPILNGLMAAEQIKAIQPYCQIIFLTAYDETYLGGQTTTGADYLLKPAHPDEIRKTLAKYIPQKKYADADPPPKHTYNDNMIKVMAFIEENLQKELNLELLSELVHLHPQYVSRLFKIETGFTITQFIANRRLKKAKHLLANTRETIAAVSESCGFTDSNYFTRVFKRHEGMTPTQFQQQAALGKRKQTSFGNYVL